MGDRVLPVDGSARPRREALEELARRVFAPYVGRGWRLVFEPFRGGWNTISREDALVECKRVLGEDHLSVSSPEITVLCTLNPKFVGLGVLRAPLDDEDLRIEE